MKKMMTCSLLAMAAGAGMMAYALNNDKTKHKTAKMINNAMDLANDKINMMR